MLIYIFVAVGAVCGVGEHFLTEYYLRQSKQGKHKWAWLLQIPIPVLMLIVSSWYSNYALLAAALAFVAVLFVLALVSGLVGGSREVREKKAEAARRAAWKRAHAYSERKKKKARRSKARRR